MQKQSLPPAIFLYPIALPSALPIVGEGVYEQLDAPIRHLHYHQCLELGLCHEGSGIFVVGDKVLPFAAGDVSFINHREPHLAQSTLGTISRWTWVYLDPLRLVGRTGTSLAPSVQREWLDAAPLCGPEFANICREREQPDTVRIVRRLVAELAARERGWEEAVQALTWELMILMRRHAPSPLSPQAAPRPDFERLAPALERLAGDLANPPAPGELARLCGLSEPHFRRLFVRTLGRAPRDYACDLRMRMAASLLSTTARPVLEISHAVGFASLSSFNRMFQKHFATAPRDWRRQSAR